MDFLNKIFESVTNKFLIMSLIGFLIYAYLPDEYITSKNIVNSISSLLLITALFDVFLKKEYLSELSNHIINGFFANQSSLKLLKKNDVIASTKNMINFLAEDLHPNLREKFKYRAARYFVDIFNSDNDELLHTFYDKYNLTIAINKKNEDENFLITEYELAYTLINNSTQLIKHDIFKKRGMKKAFIDMNTNVIEVEKLIVIKDGVDEDIDITTLVQAEVPIPEQVSINNKEEIKVLTIFKDGKPLEIEFKNTLEVKKKIIIKVALKDVVYSCHFNRVASNVDITFIDENASNIHVLNGFAFINKDKIDIEDTRKQNKRIKVNDLVFPLDQISFISTRH